LKEAIDYIYEEYCDGGRRRKLFAVGVSMGAGVLANYMAKDKGNCPLTAACSVACHFDTIKAMEFLASHLYGFYDYTLGFFCKISARPYLKQYDEITHKKCADLNASKENDKVMKLSDHFSKLVAKVAGYKSVREYFQDSSITSKLKDIRVPTFFMNSIDDIFYGPYVTPID
jgi:predicted alpha/beta-fold hydrolase